MTIPTDIDGVEAIEVTEDDATYTYMFLRVESQLCHFIFVPGPDQIA